MKSAPPPRGNRRIAAPRLGGAPAVVDPAARQEDSPLPPTTSVSIAPKKVRKALAPWLRLLAGGVLVAVVSGGVAWGARRYLLGSPRFAVRTVLIEGEAHLTAEQVAKSGGIVVGASLFGLDLEQVRAGIASDPWIENVVVTRSLPGTIRVKVTEREAPALLALGGELYLLSRDGEPFKRVESSDPVDLPVVTGFSPDQVAKDRGAVVLSCRRVLEIVGELDRMGLSARYPVQELHVEKDSTVMAILGRTALALHLGQGPFRGKIEQATKVLAELNRRKVEASVLFLDNEAHPERVVARLK